MNSLRHLEDDLKHAAASRQYAAVDHLALRYGDAARDAIAKLPAGDPAIAATARQVLDVLEWSRLVVLAGRAATAGELRRIPFLARYVRTPRTRPAMLRLDA